MWINDRNFHELRNEHEPICGTQNGTMEFKITKRPICKTLKGLPALTTLTGGVYFFLSSLNGLRYLASGDTMNTPTRT